MNTPAPAIYYKDGSYAPSDTPAHMLYFPDPDLYGPAARQWQGCPSVEITTSGRLFATWYTGGINEPQVDNYCAVAYSDDGLRFVDPYLIIRCPPESKARAIDAQLWRAPNGHIWLFWGQSMHGDETAPFTLHDGLFGVWAAVCEAPDAAIPRFGAPRYLCGGFLRNKPLVCKDGRWLLCAYDWVQPHYVFYESRNQGSSFTRRKGPDKPENYRIMPDETMLVEKQDGRLWMLARTRSGIAQSLEAAPGLWQPLVDPAFPGPNSRFYIGRLPGRELLMINHVGYTGRSHLTALLSYDDGLTFPDQLLLDERQAVAYPDAAIAEDGSIYVIYDYDRNGTGQMMLCHFTLDDIRAGRFQSPGSYAKRRISAAGKR